MGIYSIFDKPLKEVLWSLLYLTVDTLTKNALVLCVLYAILLIIIIIYGKSDERIFFGVYPMILIGIIFNPWFFELMCKKFAASTRYFRYFWCVPISAGIAYACYIVFSKRKNIKFNKYASYIVSVVLIVICTVFLLGATKTLNTGCVENTGMIPVTNVYRLQQDVIDVADVIEDNKEDKNLEVKVLYDYNVMSCIRSYDASLICEWSVGDMRWFNDNPVNQEGLDAYIAESNWSAMLCVLINEHIGEQEPLYINPVLLRTALQKYEIEYVIIRKNKSTVDTFIEIGALIGESDNYYVIKVKQYGKKLEENTN